MPTATLVTIAELKAAVHGSGGALYTDPEYQELVDAAEQLVLQYVDGVAADYADVPPVKLAVLQLSVELYQARHTAGGSGTGIDLTPYKLGRTLVSRYQGLLQPWADVGGMAG